MRLRIPVIAGVLAVAPLFGLSTVAGAAHAPRPSISSFSAVPANAAFQTQAASPVTIYSDGGYVLLSVTASNASVCDLWSSRLLSPALPSISECSSPVTVAVELPPNLGKRSIRYRFAVKALGYGSARAVASVVVDTVPNPAVAAEVTAGSLWNLVSTSQMCQSNALLMFNSNGSVSAVSGSGINGTWTSDAQSGILTILDPAGSFLVTFALAFDPASGIYEGTASVVDCNFMLSPSG